MGETGRYEYAVLTGRGGDIAKLIAQLNDLAADGWEMVTLAVQDAGFAGTALGIPIRRPLVPLPPPINTEPGWYPDPSGRWEAREWNGRAWTFSVGRNGKQHRDAPTRLPPTPGLTQ